MKQKHVIALLGTLATSVAWAQDAKLDFSPEDFPPPSPPIVDCDMDFRERGRPTEMPVNPADVADLRIVLDLDIRSIQPDGLAGFRALEPVCFYLVPDDKILMRDGRGIEYYFRKIPRWIPERIDFPARESSE